MAIQSRTAPAVPAPTELLQDGPTLAEYMAAGYKASTYPPAGFASKSTPEEIAAAIAAEVAAEQPKPESEAEAEPAPVPEKVTQEPVTAEEPAPATLPPVNEFPEAVDAPEAPVEAPVLPPVMASTGNPGEHPGLVSIQLSDLPVIEEAQNVEKLKDGDLFIAQFIYAPGTDKAWHAEQMIDLLRSGRNLLHGLTQAYWHFHYRNRPPIGQKKGDSYVMLD